MAGLYRALLTSASSVTKNLTQATSCRTKFTKSRIPPQVFEERAKEHDKYGGDPEHPHKLHIVTRVKSTMRRPYWEKKVVKSLGLMKAHEPRIHKNTPSVNNLLKIIKHLVRIEPLKLPYRLPVEEDMANTYLNEKALSVVEMVAYLEQRASDQQVISKVPSLRSTITLSKVGTSPQPTEQQSKVAEKLEVQEEEGESVRVLDMVAKLESQCLSRQSLGEGGGDLSRNNSLRRKVGRVLLAGSEPYLLPSEPVSPSVPQDSRVESVPQQLDSDLDKLSSPPKTLESIETSQCGLDTCTLKDVESSCISREETSTAAETVQSSPKDASSEYSEEPIPGMLFFAKSSTQSLKEHRLPSPSKSRSLNKEPSHIQDLEPFVNTLVSYNEEIKDGLMANQNHQTFEETERRETCRVSPEPVPFPLRRLVSHEFLETRFKIQLLLEPQQYMAFLPHHIILKIFCLLPTESLAALKCTCHYFKFLIESYDVRPADSRWVSDPRYKDDPCKQCKKKYHRGDVSLCRWHHKPYCQALPYGPGYWMCCRRSHKDTPGCNVGLHDNRWVPAFHSINMPIYKKSRDTDEDL